VLGFRRIETLQTGLRWYDVKRYGIEIVRREINMAGDPAVVIDRLKTDDARRALQIPQNVIEAGYPSNNRTKTMSNQSDGLKSVPVPVDANPADKDIDKIGDEKL